MTVRFVRDFLILVLMYNSMYFPNISFSLVTKHPIQIHG
jgi:hypothetical protein